MVYGIGLKSASLRQTNLKTVMKKILSILVLVLVTSLGFVFARERTITGKVTSSEDGSVIPGVSILLKGTSLGTVTDAYEELSIENSVRQRNACVFFYWSANQRSENRNHQRD